MTNQLLTARCSKPVIELMDTCCEMYGFTRSELMRTGAINYCQQLLLTSALESFSDLSASVRKRCDNNDMSEETLSQFAQLEKLVQDMKKHLGID